MTVAIFPIRSCDDEIIRHIIQTVGAEFGAVGDGFGPSDAEVMQMSVHYGKDGLSQYWVAEADGEVVGGTGIAPFNGRHDVCELRKLFLLPQSRGLGIGKALTEQALHFAKHAGYQQCYLDTLASMTSAIRLYEKCGFRQLEQPFPGTEHNGCDVWMLKSL